MDRSGRRHERGGCARRGQAQEFAGQNRATRKQQRCQRRDQHDRQFLRIRRRVGNDGAGNNAAIRGCRVDILAGIGLAVLGKIGFKQVALSLGFALERPQLDVLAIARRRLLLQLLQARAQAFDPPASNPRIVVERARDLAGLVANLAVEIGELRLQFLDARMMVEQGRRLFRQLRAQGHALLR